MLKSRAHVAHFYSWPQDAPRFLLNTSSSKASFFCTCLGFFTETPSAESSYPNFSLEWESALGAYNWEMGLLYLYNIVISRAGQSNFVTQGLNKQFLCQCQFSASLFWWFLRGPFPCWGWNSAQFANVAEEPSICLLMLSSNNTMWNEDIRCGWWTCHGKIRPPTSAAL